MALSNELISQFVKSTKDTTETKHTSIVYGTVVYDGKTYVKLDGSELLTPVSTTVNVTDGDRVTVDISDHKATITGNVTDPSASSGTVDKLEQTVAYKVSAEEIDATKATIDELKTKLADIDKLEAVEAEIETLEAKYANLDSVKVSDIKALNAELENIQAKFADFTDVEVDQLEALNADINQLKAYNADFTYVFADELEAVNAKINNLDVEKLTAEEANISYAKITDLVATNAVVSNLQTSKANISDLEASNAEIGRLTTAVFDADSGNIKFANIDFSNIGEAAVEKIFADSGIIKDLVVSEGTITGELVGVTIKGDLIEAGTLKADRLVVKGSDGNYYKLNTDFEAMPDVEPVEEDAIHGSVIIAESITAEKIAVDDLVAFDATIGGFNITEDSLYSGVKESVDNTTRGVYLDNDGQVAFGDESNYIKYFKDEDGNYKLSIVAGSLILGTTGSDVATLVEDLKETVESSAVTFVGEYIRTTTDEMVYLHTEYIKTSTGEDVYYHTDENEDAIYYCEIIESVEGVDTEVRYQVTLADGVYTKTETVLDTEFDSVDKLTEQVYYCEVVENVDGELSSTVYQVTEADGVYTKTETVINHTVNNDEALETKPEAPYKSGDIWITAGGYSVYCVIGSDDVFHEEDWTDSVEDLVDSVEGAANNIQNATDTAKDAQDKAEKVNLELTTMNSKIQMLEDRLRSFIVDENGGTLMDQSTDGFTWSLFGTEQDIDAITKNVDELLSKMDDSENVDELFSYMRLIDTEELDLRRLICLELGSSESPFRIQITPETVRFVDKYTGAYTDPHPKTTDGYRVLYYDEDNQLGTVCCIVEENIVTTDYDYVYAYARTDSEGTVLETVLYCIVTENVEDDNGETVTATYIYQVVKTGNFYYRTETLSDLTEDELNEIGGNHEHLVGNVVYDVTANIYRRTEVDVTEEINDAIQRNFPVVIVEYGTTTTGESVKKLNVDEDLPAYCTVTNEEGNEVHYAVVPYNYQKSAVKLDVDPEICKEFDVGTLYKILTDPVAYINMDSMHIDKAVIDTSMRIGGLEWSIRDNGNVGIMWRGDD